MLHAFLARLAVLALYIPKCLAWNFSYYTRVNCVCGVLNTNQMVYCDVAYDFYTDVTSPGVWPFIPFNPFMDSLLAFLSLQLTSQSFRFRYLFELRLDIITSFASWSIALLQAERLYWSLSALFWASSVFTGNVQRLPSYGTCIEPKPGLALDSSTLCFRSVCWSETIPS